MPGNNSQVADPFWWDRWQAWQDVVRESSVKGSTTEPFRTLFERLLGFGNKQFGYFFYGFGVHKSLAPDHPALAGAYPRHTLEPDEDRRYPAQYVLRWTFDQLGYDYAVIQQAMLQRQHGTAQEKETLALADGWGQALIAPAAQTLLPGRAPLVVSYFHGSPNIRVMPYADVALVGIPISTVREERRRDLFVMGHELGHHLYWHGIVNGKPLRESVASIFPDQPNQGQGANVLVAPWLQEIFADVFSCVAGSLPAMAHAGMAMVWDNNPARRYVEDGVYPPDALRPRIFRDALTEIAGRLGFEAARSVSLLKEIYDGARQAFLEGESSEARKRLEGIGTREERLKKIKEVRKRLEAIEATEERLKKIEEAVQKSGVVGKIVDLLMDKAYSDQPLLLVESLDALHAAILLMGSLPVEAQQQEKPVLTWYQQLEAHITEMAKGAEKWPMEWQALSERVASERDQPDKSNKCGFETLRDNALTGEHNDANPVKKQDWKVVFQAGGWTVEGPETRPTMDLEHILSLR